jgi:hypothetical protein
MDMPLTAVQTGKPLRADFEPAGLTRARPLLEGFRAFPRAGFRRFWAVAARKNLSFACRRSFTSPPAGRTKAAREHRARAPRGPESINAR